MPLKTAFQGILGKRTNSSSNLHDQQMEGQDQLKGDI